MAAKKKTKKNLDKKAMKKTKGGLNFTQPSPSITDGTSNTILFSEKYARPGTQSLGDGSGAAGAAADDRDFQGVIAGGVDSSVQRHQTGHVPFHAEFHDHPSM